MSLLRRKGLYPSPSDNREGYRRHRALLNSPAGYCHPRRVGHGTMVGAGRPKVRESHDDMAGTDRNLESVAGTNELGAAEPL